ncbi:hypothetical protein, partial [Undibacterium sp.]|uniref:hypothetical protein n=1 Tax=Undibacterium sp. TaxID=1914977 RepID=UPI00374D9E35
NPDSLRRSLEGVGLQVFNAWQISYLAGEAPNNLFIAAQRPGNGSTAASLAPIFAALAGSALPR